MPTLLHGPGCNLREWQGMPPSCAWADLQSMHGLCCYGNITRTRNVSEYMLVLALCLVAFSRRQGSGGCGVGKSGAGVHISLRIQGSAKTSQNSGYLLPILVVPLILLGRFTWTHQSAVCRGPYEAII